MTYSLKQSVENKKICNRRRELSRSATKKINKQAKIIKTKSSKNT